LVDLPPVLPLLYDLLAVEKHVAVNDACGVATPFLAVVDVQRLPDILGKRAIELVLQVVDIVDGGSFTKLVK
jgi:hypothetical protein